MTRFKQFMRDNLDAIIWTAWVAFLRIHYAADIQNCHTGWTVLLWITGVCWFMILVNFVLSFDILPIQREIRRLEQQKAQLLAERNESC